MSPISDPGIRNKYEQVILTIIKIAGGQLLGKKRLAKLLYFTDFDHFWFYERPITHEAYYHQDHGPLGADYTRVLHGMQQQRSLKIEHVTLPDGKPAIRFTALNDPLPESFNSEERAIIDGVMQQYGRMTGGELERITHEEPPYVGTRDGEEIFYELTHYRSAPTYQAASRAQAAAR